MRKASSAALVVAVCAGALSGCGFKGVYDVPLPGGANVGDHPYRVKVEFRDVLDLVQQANVKLNDVAVGRVEKIGVAADGWSAEATLLINGDVRVPANTGASLEQSSLLGEKVVTLVPPAKDATGQLRDGAVIPLAATNRNPEVEELLGALSMLLNGGGVEQLQTVAKEVANALNGNEPQIKELLSNVDILMRTLDGQRGSITAAIDGLDRLSATLAAQTGNIDQALTGLGPGLEVLNQQSAQLVTMLQSLNKLSGVAVDTVNRSKDDLVADLKALTPTLTKLAESGQAIPRSLQVLLTFPFTDNAADTIRGDYTNLDVNLDLNLDSVLSNLGDSSYPPLSAPVLDDTAQPVLPLPISTPSPPTAQVPGGAAVPQSGFGGLLDALLGGGH